MQTSPPGPNTPADASLIAVVDDDPSVASAIQQWLGMLSIPSVAYHDADSLLRALGLLSVAQRGTPVDPQAQKGWLRAAVIDLNLPGMNGFELSRRLQQALPGIRIVVITAANAEILQMFGGPPEGVVCLDKPFTLDAIERALLGP